MDLSLLAAENTNAVAMQVYHPKTGKPVEGMTVQVNSLLSEDVQHVIRKQQARAATRVGRDGKPLELTDDESKRNAAELFDALIGGWTGMQFNGADFACTPENKRMIVSDSAKRWDWLLRDVMNFASEQGNFFRADDDGRDVGEDARVAEQRSRKG